MVTKLTAANFEKEVVKSDIPVIIDFFADWCGPCRMMGPVFEEVSRDYEGKLRFLKLSVEENPKVADQFGVQGIPCLVIIDRGKEAGRIVGFNPKEMLKQKIDAVLAKIK
ncbi:thioredoxin [Candidatus Woesearchaeota archaeon]|nr:thioredoxin [Candidatus Woesearchaeota archaeon]